MDFKLRPWRASDAADVAHFANNERIACNLRDVFPYPYTLDDAKSYVNSCEEAGEERQLCRAIEVEGRVVGSIGVFPGNDVYRRSAELGYWLAEEYWGQGVMTAAVDQICREAFRHWDIVRIHAEPFAHNAASRRVLEKAGFALEGILRKSVVKNGQICDSCMYALIKE